MKRRRKNPKRHAKRHSKKRHNPIKVHHKRRYRKNPKISVKGILEQVKPIALGAVGALVISKGISMIPVSAEYDKYKPYIKLASGVAIAYFGKKYAVAKLGGIFVATLALRDIIAQYFPSLVSGDDDYQLIDDQSNQMLGAGQVMFGAENFASGQVNFAGQDPFEDPYNFGGF